MKSFIPTVGANVHESILAPLNAATAAPGGGAMEEKKTLQSQA